MSARASLILPVVLLCAGALSGAGCRSKHAAEPSAAPAPPPAKHSQQQSVGIRKIIPDRPEPPPVGRVAASSLVATLDQVMERLDKAGHNFDALPDAVTSGRQDLGEMERQLGAYRQQHQDPSQRDAATRFITQADAARSRLARVIGEATAAQRMAAMSGSWARMDQVLDAAHLDVKATHDLLSSAP